MAAQPVAVPDLGDFTDVPVIEVLVKPGDPVKKNDSLVVLESDKASMEVPSDTDGIVSDVRVKVGDKVSKGTVLLTLEDTATANNAPQSQAEVPGADEKRVTQPGVTQPGVTQPGVTQPDVTQPGVTQPGVTQPDVTQPGVTLSAVEAPPSNVEAQTIELKVPDIGDFTDVPVIEVLVKPGQSVAKEQSLVVLESDKASMEVPASEAGVVQDVRVNIGDKVAKGTVIATITRASAALQTDQTATARPLQQPTQTPSPPPQQAPQAAAPQDEPAPRENAGAADGAIPHASPSIRRFARELGVALERVTPSGPNRRITRDDVQNFVKSALRAPAAAASSNGAALGLAPWPNVDFAKYGPIERKPLSRIQKLSGPNLHRNWVMIPHVTQNDDADVTGLEAFRKEINRENEGSGTKVTMLSFLVRACIAALKKYPIFNSSLDGGDIVYKNYYNIGFAADTPNGLMVPVLRDADKKSLTEVAHESAQLAAKAREGKLSLAEMQGGTFTISSLGSIGGTYFTPIINAPEVAILGACKAAIRPVWDGKTFQPRLMQPLSLSYDHRVIDGAAAARFTAYVAEVLGDLRRALV